ncbi:MAG: hypothetical protein KDB18_05780 [Salinibacterium sp.]|nr:hypothetical protein [Salinibacterium sp.]
MRIEPNMLCSVVVPAAYRNAGMYYEETGDLAFKAGDLDGLLCVTINHVIHPFAVICWHCEFDDPPVDTKGETIGVPEDWLKPLPPAPIRVEQIEEATA